MVGERQIGAVTVPFRSAFVLQLPISAEKGNPSVCPNSSDGPTAQGQREEVVTAAK